MINEKLEKLNQEIAKGEARNGRTGSVPEELCWKVSF